MHELKLTENGSERNLLLTLSFIFSGFIVAMNCLWVFKNSTPPAWDQAWYLYHSKLLYKALTNDGLMGLAKSIPLCTPDRAPLLPILTLPFYLVFGDNEISALVSAFSFIPLMSCFLFRFVEKIRNARAAFVSVLVVQTMPLFFILAGDFYVDYGLAALTVTYLYFLQKSELFECKKTNVLAGVFLGLGMLQKSSFVLFVVFPTLWILFLRCTDKKKAFDREIVKELFKIAGIALLISSTWYASNMKTVFGHAVDVAIGREGSFFMSPLWDYMKRIASLGMSSYYSLFLAGAVFVLLMMAVKLHKNGVMDKRKIVNDIVFLMLWFVPAFVVFCLAKAKDMRFVLPILVVPGIVIGISTEIVLSRVKNLLVFIFLIAIMLFEPVNFMIHETFVSDPPRTVDWRLREVLAYVSDEIKEKRVEGSNSIMSLMDHRVLNSNTLTYALESNHLRDLIQVSGWDNRQRDMAVALKKIEEEKPAFLIWADGLTPGEYPDFSNTFSLELHRVVESGKLPYGKDKLFHLSNGVDLVLYKRNTVAIRKPSP